MMLFWGIMLFKCSNLFLFLQLYILWVDTRFWLTGFDGILNQFSSHITAKRQVFLTHKHTMFPCPCGSGRLYGVWWLVLCHGLPSLCVHLIFSMMFSPSNALSPVSLSSHILAFLWWIEPLHSPQSLSVSVNPISLSSQLYPLKLQSYPAWAGDLLHRHLSELTLCTSLSSDNPAYRQMTVFKCHLIQW